MKEQRQIPDEQTLIERCVSGDRLSMKLLYDEYSGRVFSTLIRILGNREDAEDALQETFVKIFKHIGSFEGKSKLSTWLYRVATTTAIDMMRRRKKHEGHLDVEEMSEYLPDARNRDPQIMCSMLLEEKIGELPDGYREVFVLYALDGFKHHEIAGMLGISEGTSRSHFYHARANLRKMLLPYLEVIRYGMQ